MDASFFLTLEGTSSYSAVQGTVNAQSAHAQSILLENIRWRAKDFEFFEKKCRWKETSTQFKYSTDSSGKSDELMAQCWSRSRIFRQSQRLGTGDADAVGFSSASASASGLRKPQPCPRPADFTPKICFSHPWEKNTATVSSQIVLIE